jgi:hypothetical protein
MKYSYKDFPTSSSILAIIEGHPGIQTHLLAHRLGMPKTAFQKYVYSKGVFDQIAGRVKLSRERWYLKADHVGSDRLGITESQGHNSGYTISEIVSEASPKAVETSMRDVRADMINVGTSYSISVTETVASTPFLVDHDIATDHIKVVLNRRHSAFSLFEPIISSTLSNPHSEKEGYRATMFLLLSWAKYESSLNITEKAKAQDIRTDWGRVLRNLVATSVSNRSSHS